MELTIDPTDGSQRFFYLAYLGVDRRCPNEDVGNLLLLRGAELRGQRAKRNKRYYATLVNTFFIPEFEERLIKHGFQRVPQSQYLWFKKKRSAR